MLKIKIDSKRQIKPVRRTWIRACEALLWHSADPPPPGFIRRHQFLLARLPVHEAIRGRQNYANNNNDKNNKIENLKESIQSIPPRSNNSLNKPFFGPRPPLSLRSIPVFTSTYKMVPNPLEDGKEQHNHSSSLSLNICYYLLSFV